MWWTSIVISQPNIKKITENIERVGLMSMIDQKCFKRIRDSGVVGIEMHIGDKECVCHSVSMEKLYFKLISREVQNVALSMPSVVIG